MPHERFVAAALLGVPVKVCQCRKDSLLPPALLADLPKPHSCTKQAQQLMPTSSCCRFREQQRGCRPQPGAE